MDKKEKLTNALYYYEFFYSSMLEIIFCIQIFIVQVTKVTQGSALFPFLLKTDSFLTQYILKIENRLPFIHFSHSSFPTSPPIENHSFSVSHQFLVNDNQTTICRTTEARLRISDQGQTGLPREGKQSRQLLVMGNSVTERSSEERDGKGMREGILGKKLKSETN